MKAVIYFIQFLKDDAKSVGGGGIGTLISLMCPLLEEMGHEVTVYQCAGRAFDVQWGNTRVVGVPGYPGAGRPNEKVVQELRELAKRQLGQTNYLEIFAADFFAVKNNNPLAICVQNGLAWDSAIELLTPQKFHHYKLTEKLFRFRCQRRGLRRFETCFNRVAVDLYFLNWYRSFRGPDPIGRLYYNPNPAPLADWDCNRASISSSNELRIIFARRLNPEKGTRIAAEIFDELLNLRSNVSITIAGEGPDLDFLVKKFAGVNRVRFISYQTEHALEVHRQHDIAFVPSLCGEATCLAILEGMAAGCAVVAGNMGGTITQIINGYNGILVWPNRQELLNGILKLIDSPEQMLQIQKRGWETSQLAFNLKTWQENWKGIINDIIAGKD